MKWNFALIAAALIAAGFLTGCANLINARTRSHYYDAGVSAEEAGDLVRARECYSEAHSRTPLCWKSAC